MAHRNSQVYDRAATGGEPYSDQLLNVAQVRTWLNCSRSFVYKLVADGKLKARRIGDKKGIRVFRSSVSAYLAKKRNFPGEI